MASSHEEGTLSVYLISTESIAGPLAVLRRCEQFRTFGPVQWQTSGLDRVWQQTLAELHKRLSARLQGTEAGISTVHDMQSSAWDSIVARPQPSASGRISRWDDTRTERVVVFEREADAESFIVQQGLSTAIQAVETLMLASFPTLRSARLVLEHDPEIPDCRRVCLEAVVAGSVDQVLDWEDEFTLAFCRELSPEQRELLTFRTIIADE